MAFGSFQQGQSQPMADINTTPLVDVMLVLLIIFIVTTPLLTQAIKIELPQASAQANPDKPEAVSLAMDAAGKLYWNNEPVAEADLPACLAAAAARRPQPELQLRVDRETRYQKIAEVMGLAREAGIAKLGFVTEPKR